MANRTPTYRPPGLATNADRRRDYDRDQRDAEAYVFYNSTAWKKLRAWKLQASPLCEACKDDGRLTPAQVVHHKIERAERPDMAMLRTNLESLCKSCHSRLHASRKTGEGDANLRQS
jgi:5-methylcytosine-specific restriction enzyme A